MKFYAIKKGRKPGIYTSWPEAQEQVQGYSGAQFKSFGSQAEAETYLQGEATRTTNPDGLLAYVDGSYDKRKPAYGSGVVFVQNGKELDTLSFAGNRDLFLESHQVAGEVLASTAAIDWAIQKGYQEITICYDYQGVASWATGEWATKKPISQAYKRAFDRYKDESGIQVNFQKIKAHSGNQFNDRADALAKEALGIAP